MCRTCGAVGEMPLNTPRAPAPASSVAEEGLPRTRALVMGEAHLSINRELCQGGLEGDNEVVKILG